MTITQTKSGNGALSTELAPPSNRELIAEILSGKAASYTPLAEGKDIELSIGMVKKMLCVPTASGKVPTDQDCVKYIMMSMQRGLNPWAQDCYLLGYDSSRGPTFSMVVAIQALLKRAELARTLDGGPAFDGMDSGVIVERRIAGVGEDGKAFDRTEVLETVGDIVLGSDTLLGGWAKIYRKDREHPFCQRIKLATYKKPTPIWGNDPGGMICKCAEAHALRQAFPSDIGGLYLASEIEAFAEEAGKRAADRGDRGTVNLEHLSAGEIPPQAEEEGQGSGSGFAGGASAEGQQQADTGPQEGQGQTATGPISEEEQLNNWAYDISQCATPQELEKMDASTADPAIKARVQKMIAARLKELTPKKQPGLPGAQ